MQPDRRRAIRAHSEHIRAFEQAALPLYELEPGWRGPRSLGDAEHWESAGEIGDGEPVRTAGSAYSLIHGDGEPDRGQPYLEVMTSTPDALEGPLRWVLRTRAEPYVQLDPAELDQLARQEGPDDPLPGATEQPMLITVGGSPLEFESVIRGPAWAARRSLGDHVLTLVARHFEPAAVSVVRVADLGPYIDATRKRFERYAGEDG